MGLGVPILLHAIRCTGKRPTGEHPSHPLQLNLQSRWHLTWARCRQLLLTTSLDLTALWALSPSRRRRKGSRGAHRNHCDSRDRDSGIPVRLPLSEFVQLMYELRDPKLRRSRISQTSQMLTSTANQISCSLVIVNPTLALRFSYCEPPCEARALFPIRCALPCIFPDCAHRRQTRVHRTWTPCEDFDEDAGTAASLDHIIARLQTLEAADQVRNASDSLVVINVRSGLVHLVVGDPSNQRSGRPVSVSATGV